MHNLEWTKLITVLTIEAKYYMGFLGGLLWLFACGNSQQSQKEFGGKSTPTYQEQLEAIQSLGFTLNDGVDASTDIIQYLERNKEFDVQPYHLLYQTLGSTLVGQAYKPITNKVWDFDLEAIEDHGDYVRIMQNISRITNGDLVFENLKDFVDIDNEIAWVSFTFRGEAYKWDLKVDNDWADGDLFDRVQALTEKYKMERKFTFFNTGGQDFVLGYSTPEELQKLRNMAGLEIVWLKAKGQIY